MKSEYHVDDAQKLKGIIMFGRNTEIIFQITAWLSFLVLILILLTLITPRLLSWIPLFKNINRKHTL